MIRDTLQNKKILARVRVKLKVQLPWKVVLSTKENGSTANVMVRASKNGWTAHAMKVRGGMERPMETVNYIMLMVTFMKETGWMIKQMVTEPTLMQMEPNM